MGSGLAIIPQSYYFEFQQRALNVRDFGATGNGTTDDTNALQNALNAASKTGVDLIIPTGTYKVTAPLVLEELTNGVHLNWPRIIGQGWNVTSNPTAIVGYNIPAHRSVVELLGDGNTQTAMATMENLEIQLDASSDPTAFCLTVGDARQFRAEKVRLHGTNALKLRCGSATGETSYAMIGTKFEECVFEATGTTGWAVMHEIVETGVGAGFDHLKFDTCLFLGLTMIFAYTAELDNCLWSVDPSRGSVNYASGVLNGYTVNFANAIWVCEATAVKITKAYFEDYNTSILVQPINGAYCTNVEVDSCYFNGLSNYTNVSTGKPYQASCAVDIQPEPTSAGFVDTVIIKNNTFGDVRGSNTNLFTVAPVRNNAAFNLIIEDNVVTDPGHALRYIDTASVRFSFSDPRVNKPNKTFSVDFDVTLAQSLTYGTLGEGDFTVDTFMIPYDCWLQRVEVLTNTVMTTTSVLMDWYKNGTAVNSVNFMDTTKLDAYLSEPGKGDMKQICTAIPMTRTDTFFTKGDKLQIATYPTVTLVAGDVGAKIRFRVHLAY